MNGQDKTEPDAATPIADAPAAEAADASRGFADARPAPAYDDEPERPRSPVATRALAALGLVLGGGLAALSLAPSLPAPVAQIFGVTAADGAPSAAVDARLTSAGSAADAALAAATATNDRIAEIDAALAALRDQVASGGGAGGAPDPALSGRLDAVEATLTTLADTVNALSARGVGRPGGDLTALEKKIAALEAAQKDEIAWRATAEARADDARRYAAVTAALGQIDRAMTLGAAFPEALQEAVAAAGEPAPPALTAAAEKGAPTREALKATFPAAAFKAIEAALVGEAEAEQQAFAGVIGRLQAKVTGLPTEVVQGDSAPAVLSRARFALFNGDIDGALAAVAALPPPAQAAMADWTAGAKLRSEADAALDAWRGAIAANL
jgi:hypothetical protein